MKNFPLAQPDIHPSDIAAVTRVLQSPHLSRGPVVTAFEQAFCQLLDCRYASAVSSGSAGLIIALQALGVQPGDEVISVSFTVPATINSIVAIGAKPVMVDIEAETLGMCPAALAAAITPKTTAIIIVHAFGKCAKINQLLAVAHSHGIKVIEDACEAIGNQYQQKYLGTFADIGVFGFYPNKQITTGEGGMLVTNDEALFHSLQLLKNHGRSMNGDNFDQIHFGWNFRLSDINAALGLSQLRRINEIKQKRQNIATLYQTHLASNQAIVCPEFSTSETHSAWFVYVIRLLKHERDWVMTQMQQAGIGCGRYFAPVHLQPYYRRQSPELKLKVTEKTASQCLALPFYPQLTAQDIDFVCDNLLKHTCR